MMLGLERIERMRLFAAELTAPTSPTPRVSRLTGGRAAPTRRTGESAAAEPSQETGLQGRSRQPTQVGDVSICGKGGSGFLTWPLGGAVVLPAT